MGLRASLRFAGIGTRQLPDHAILATTALFKQLDQEFARGDIDIVEEQILLDVDASTWKRCEVVETKGTQMENRAPDASKDEHMVGHTQESVQMRKSRWRRSKA